MDNVLLRWPWWAWALITWGVCLLIAILIAIAAPSNVRTTPRDALDVGTLTSKVCSSTAKLQQLGMNLTLIRPDQCEAPHYGSLIVEPENTWSNFGYLLAGLLILFRRPRLLGIAVGVNFCIIAVTSGFYHASLEPYAQSFDVAWIYALLLSVIAYAFEAMRIRYSQRRFPRWLTMVLFGVPIAFAVVVGILKANGIEFDSTSATIVLLVILTVPVGLILLDRFLLTYWRFLLDVPIIAPLFRWMEVINRSDFGGREWLGTGVRCAFAVLILVSAGASFFLRLTDGCGNLLCYPHSPIQAHASWHVLGAGALWWTFDFLGQAIASPRSTMLWLGRQP